MSKSKNKTNVVAIDGPCGSGKSTVGKLVAQRLGYVYIDTGAMYRAIAYKALREGVSLDDKDSLERIASQAKIEFRNIDNRQHIILDGEDITDKIRTPKITAMSSVVSAVPGVRTNMVKLQQEIGRNWNVVMDGRDIGTVVYPDAAVKIYLDASVKERARRRYEEDLSRGLRVNFEETKRVISERDRRDMTRKDSPLRRAPDAVYIDTTNLSIQEVVEKIIKIVEERL